MTLASIAHRHAYLNRNDIAFIHDCFDCCLNAVSANGQKDVTFNVSVKPIININVFGFNRFNKNVIN